MEGSARGTSRTPPGTLPATLEPRGRNAGTPDLRGFRLNDGATVIMPASVTSISLGVDEQ